MKVRITNRCDDLPAPARSSPQASGFDLHAAVENDVTLPPGERVLIPTGITIELPSGYEGQVRPRSGLAVKHGISVVNSPGTIDADYRGEVSVILINLGNQTFTVHRGDRIAQLVIAAVETCELEVVDELTETRRGPAGFGSTGV